MTKQPEALRYEFEDGKYIAFVGQGTCTITRHGELWRDLTGDKFVGCLFSEIDRLHEVNEDLLNVLNSLLLAAGMKDPQPWRDARADVVELLKKVTGETE